MCGIALIVSGVRIDFSSSLPESSSHGGLYDPSVPKYEEVQNPVVSVDEFMKVLQRRGPDHLGSEKVFLHLNRPSDITFGENLSVLDKKDDAEGGKDSVSELHFLGAMLQLRGTSSVFQPMRDSSGNVLVYNVQHDDGDCIVDCKVFNGIPYDVNEFDFLASHVCVTVTKYSKLFQCSEGEIFGGIDVSSDKNDGEILMHELGGCCSCSSDGHSTSCSNIGKGEKSVPEILSMIKGPWALIYWQASSKTIWFSRDAFGRRSLLVHWPNLYDPRFILSSVSPLLPVKNSGNTDGTDDPDCETVNNGDGLCYWEELSCGIYSWSIDISDSVPQQNTFIGHVRKHGWTDPLLKKLINWDRTYVIPKSKEFHKNSVPPLIELHVLNGPIPEGMHSNVDGLDKLVVRKSIQCGEFLNPSTISVIQSDSIATGEFQDSLPAHEVLISLKESVMKRISMDMNFQSTLRENREEFVPVAVLFSGGLDSMILAALLDQCLSSSYVIDLLNVSFDGEFAPDRESARAGLRELQRFSPSRRWRLVEINADLSDLTSEVNHVKSIIYPSNTYMDLNIGIALWLAAGGDGWVYETACDHHKHQHPYKYKSEAKILLVGSGADEQCAGYGRHRTKYRMGGTSWTMITFQARFPFLDEDVINTLLEIPLWDIAELDQPVGRGDKKILREVAWLLGLKGAAVHPKRAIQFGSRIARESNRKNFGSNRAANQASAGSAQFRE
ncbi:hypothetical protein QJS04_geneDACA006935 [Acorus gramineus]|uniref:Glutamine amidotransferase type-2 domain-containing protein n=1 Tax=Acorus gramineus TaxID=55184 RepID=A0AAV9AXM4_ACOGR|nr:hypothetical protein QJS04_geneDACA006935 [Acorus gramineus]